MKLFTQWFIINAGIATASFFALQKDLFNIIIKNDISYISVATMVLFVVMCGFCGKLSAEADLLNSAESPNAYKLINKIDFGWFVSGHFLNLGLLGTVIGFCYMISGTLAENAEINSTIQTLKVGAGTALYTTLVGLVCYMLLQIQLYIIQYKFKK